jgi:hypothetical protein
MSASIRKSQLVVLLLCQGGLAMYALQPLPAACIRVAVGPHAVSAHPRVELDLTSDVPPVATTWEAVAGNDAPYPLSPVAAIMKTPGWL